jgi:hypothetical protein
MLSEMNPGASAAVAKLLKKKGEAFGPREAEKDQRRAGRYAEDDEDASEEFVSVKDGLKSRSSKAVAR